VYVRTFVGVGAPWLQRYIDGVCDHQIYELRPATHLVTARAVDLIQSPGLLMRIDDAVEDLRQRLLSSAAVPARRNERAAAEPLIQEFLRGLGNKADEVLSGYMERVAAELVGLVNSEQRKFASKPTFENVVEVTVFGPTRTGRSTVSEDRYGALNKSTGYEGWQKSMYTQVWFDSAPERTVANMLDDADAVAYWVRLIIGDLPILWSDAGNWYNPDFVAVETGGIHWIVEVKADNEMESADVQAKKEAAKRWANHVSADPSVDATWRYLLVSESQIKTAKDSWTALKSLGE